MRSATAALVVVAAIGAASCGDDADDGGGDGGERERRTGAQIVWLEARGAPDERRVRIGYETDPCTRAREAEVAETSRTVTITLLDPERDPSDVCIQLAKPGCATVALERALGTRKVVDGAPGAFPPAIRRQDRRPFSVFEPCRRVPVAG
jgi:hypothetical protein